MRGPAKGIPIAARQGGKIAKLTYIYIKVCTNVQYNVF